MTSETRTVIEFADIDRVEFECPKCHTRLTKKLTEQNTVPTRCRGGVCGHVFIADTSSELAYLQAALDLMGRYAKNEQSFILRLELKPSASQTSKQVR